MHSYSSLSQLLEGVNVQTSSKLKAQDKIGTVSILYFRDNSYHSKSRRLYLHPTPTSLSHKNNHHLLSPHSEQRVKWVSSDIHLPILRSKNSHVTHCPHIFGGG